MKDLKLEIGEPSFVSNLTVYPVFGSEGEIEVDTLEESYARGTTHIHETGVVQELEIDYSGDWPMFIHEGEEIIGARQNRIFAMSMLLPRGRRKVPVLCAEEGRWGDVREPMPSGYIAYPRVRSIISQSISLHRKPDQSEVWKEITRKQNSLRVTSATRAMTESFRKQEEELSYYKEYKPREEQIGFLAFSNLGFLGAEVFASGELFRRFLGKLLISYGLDALEHRAGEGVSNQITPEKVIKALRDTNLTRSETPGIGEELRGLTRALVLRALLLSRIVVHLSVLPR